MLTRSREAMTLAACLVLAGSGIVSAQDIPDRLAGGSCAFTPCQTYQTFDSGWNYGSTKTADVPVPDVLRSPTISAYEGAAPNGTALIGFGPSPFENTGKLSSWRRNLGMALDADTIYRVRTTLETDAVNFDSHWTRVRFGGDFYADGGQSEIGFASKARALPTASPRTIDLYHWVKAESVGESLPGESDQPALQFDIVEENSGFATPYATTLGAVTIDSTTRDCLSGGTVLRNHGVASLTNEDGWAAPSEIREPYGAATDTFVTLRDVGSDITSSVSFSSPIPDAANITYATDLSQDGETGFSALFDSRFATSFVTLNPAKLYAIDVWISAPAAPNSTTVRLPAVRLRWTARSIAANQGAISTTLFNLNPDQDFNGVLDNRAGILEPNRARHYTSVWQPSLNTSAQPITDYWYFLDFMFNRTGGLEVKPNGTLSVERLVLTEYDVPTF